MGLDEATVTSLDPELLRSVLTPDALAAFEHTLSRGRELLESRTLWNVNSTAHGGGVAEMLRSLIGYTRGGGSDARWMVITATVSSSASRSACTTGCTATRATADRWARPSAPPTSAPVPPTRS